MIRGTIVVLFACLAFLPAIASETDDREKRALAMSQGVVGAQVPDFTFTNTDGAAISLTHFRGKPLLVSLVYTSCADVCPVIIESLLDATEVANDTFGKDAYNVITVGFDTRHDTPARMASFAKARSAGGDNWLFLASNDKDIDRFTQAVGFDYAASAGGFSHPGQVTVLDRDGRIAGHVYGSLFDPPAIVEPLKSLFAGEAPIFSIKGLGDRIRLICTVYDPRTNSYYVDYSIVYSVIAGALSLAGVAWFLIREIRKSQTTSGA